MLTDDIVIPKPRWVAFDWTVFIMDLPQNGLVNWSYLRFLNYERDANWGIHLVGHTLHGQKIQEACDACNTARLDLLSLSKFSFEDANKWREFIQNMDLVYAPTLQRVFPEVQHRLRFPQSAKAAVEAVCHFSKAMEPFTPENYYRFLDTYGE